MWACVRACVSVCACVRTCRHVVFAEEKEEVMVNRADSTLMHKCSNEIRRHCDGRLG